VSVGPYTSPRCRTRSFRNILFSTTTLLAIGFAFLGAWRPEVSMWATVQGTSPGLALWRAELRGVIGAGPVTSRVQLVQEAARHTFGTQATAGWRRSKCLHHC
jgi:hypothetical protein